TPHHRQSAGYRKASEKGLAALTLLNEAHQFLDGNTFHLCGAPRVLEHPDRGTLNDGNAVYDGESVLGAAQDAEFRGAAVGPFTLFECEARTTIRTLENG